MARIWKREVRAGYAVREKRWRKIIERWECSGLRQKEFCERQGLSVSAFRWWRCELKRRGKKREKRRSIRAGEPQGPMKWIPVEVIGRAWGETPRSSIEIVLSQDRRIRIGESFDRAVLKQVIAVLEEVASC